MFRVYLLGLIAVLLISDTVSLFDLVYQNTRLCLWGGVCKVSLVSTSVKSVKQVMMYFVIAWLSGWVPRSNLLWVFHCVNLCCWVTCHIYVILCLCHNVCASLLYFVVRVGCCRKTVHVHYLIFLWASCPLCNTCKIIICCSCMVELCRCQRSTNNWNVNSRSIHVRYMSSFVRLSSVCRLSFVCNVRAPYLGNWNFRQCFYAI